TPEEALAELVPDALRSLDAAELEVVRGAVLDAEERHEPVVGHTHEPGVVRGRQPGESVGVDVPEVEVPQAGRATLLPPAHQVAVQPHPDSHAPFHEPDPQLR